MTDLLMWRGAWFEDDGEHRTWLSRKWADGPTVTFCMKNPSTADAEKEDPTLHRIIGFARRWGFMTLSAIVRCVSKSLGAILIQSSGMAGPPEGDMRAGRLPVKAETVSHPSD